MKSIILIQAIILATIYHQSFVIAFTNNHHHHQSRASYSLSSSSSSSSNLRSSNSCSTPFFIQTHLNGAAAPVLPTPEESAKALTEYMTKAHEEKIRAVSAAEAKSKSRIEELEAEVAKLKEQLSSSSSSTPSTPTIINGSYDMPATNKALAQKVQAYQTFLSNYLVKAQVEKVQAVAMAEQKVMSKFVSKQD